MLRPADLQAAFRQAIAAVQAEGIPFDVITQDQDGSFTCVMSAGPRPSPCRRG